MRTFKKACISFALFVGMLALASAIIIEPMIQNGLSYYCDGKYRKETAGEYDLLFIGDSDGLCAFIPSVFYEKTGINSYNLSQEKNTGLSEYYLLSQELLRNPVKDVILQVGIDTFVRDYSQEHNEGNAITVMRTNNLLERTAFLCKYVSLDGMLDIYSNLLTRGVLCWARYLIGDDTSAFHSAYKGWHKMSIADVTISEDEAIKSYNTERINVAFRNDRITEFLQMIQLCKDNDINVTVIVVPMADKYVWKKSNGDAFYQTLSGLCVDNGVRFIDFNLYNDRYDLFSDSFSFKDGIHLSEQGARDFTELLSELYFCEDSMYDQDLFYKSYSLMKLDSPYAVYLQNF